MSPADGRHPHAPLPRCSCCQAEACCAAGSLGPHGAPQSRYIDQCQLRVTRAWHGVLCKAIHIMGFGGRLLHLGTSWPELKWSCFRSWQPARVLAVAQPERLIRVTTHRFGSLPPPRTTGCVKGRVTELLVSFLPIVPARRSCAPPFSTPGFWTPPLSTHWLLSPPKPLPSRLMVTSQSLDRR